MGFRSTFTSADKSVEWPQWFKEKYSDSIRFPDSGVGAISSKSEFKTYSTWADLAIDIQNSIEWNRKGCAPFIFVFLHECGGVTRCKISENEITWSEPLEWKITDEVTHSYCSGCSESIEVKT